MTVPTESSRANVPAQQPQNESQHAYRPDIDGLRAFAVLLVIVFHVFPEVLRGGFVGVDVFFVISGFLIGGIILRDLAGGKFSFLHFYARRILRIFPALALVLGAVLIAGYVLLFSDEYERLGKHVFGGAAFISNLMYYSEAGYWDISAKLKPLLHLWSLGIEEQFYIIIPIVLAVAWKWKCRLPLVIAVLLLASFACNLYYYSSHQELDFYMPFTRFWEIFIGVMLAALAERKPSPWHAGPQITTPRAKALWAVIAKDDWRRARNALSIVGMGCLIVGVLASRNRHFPGHRALWPTLGAAFVIMAGSQAWLNRKVLANKLAVGLGLISYPLYLWHWPLLSFAVILDADVAGSQYWLAVRFACILISVCLAFLTYILVERPVRFGKGNRKTRVCVLFILMVCIGGIGLHISQFGAPVRSFMEIYEAKLAEMKKAGVLVHPPWNDGSILQYAPELEDIEYARYRNAGGKRTVAVVGDSHAPPVFHGMVEKNSALGLNSVLLLYSPLNCETRVLDVIKKKEDISDVFIVMRGVNYLAGGLDVDGQQPYDPAWELCSGDYFKTWLQNFVDDLNGAGKRIYIVSENPVFPSLPRVPLNRPFVLSPRSAAIIAKDEVYEHQKVYLDTLAGIHGAEIINGMDLFCPDGQCSMFAKNGTPLYVDDDHLSAYGGVYLVENLLEPYLSAIAERGTDQ